MTRKQRGIAGAVSAALVGLYGSPASAAVNTVTFSTADAGVTKAVPEWGVDTALGVGDEIRLGVHNIGVDRVDVVRATFYSDQPLTSNGNGTFSLSAQAKAAIDFRLGMSTAAGAKPLTLLPGSLAATYDEEHTFQTIKATVEYIRSRPGFANRPIRVAMTCPVPDVSKPIDCRVCGRAQ